MDELTHLIEQINTAAKSKERVIVAIVGAPGSGKSTLVAKLQQTLNRSAVVPMDGFHLDNCVLQAKGLMARKGAPESFDAAGYYQLLSRIKYSKETVYAPIFDRRADLSRAGAIEICSDKKVILTEGNYLLLQQPSWCQLAELFDLTVFLQVPMATLRERLIERWLAQGLAIDEAVVRAESNDLINAKMVDAHSAPADVLVTHF